ncbi:MAG TPA: SPOR domain-containing protein [Cytophagaceae bacterium]|jgi:cell division protein FtsN|nr:SPOR domain-containing protein [Cytophagaceae bacterium]
MIEKYIKELLFDHECVVLPEFGGFITHYVSAEIHPITNKFSPPAKRVAFNEQIKLNDGLLISTIAYHENIGTDQAAHELRAFIEKVKGDLKTDNLFVIKDIGKFFYNPENRLEFEPGNNINFLEENFGLTELFFKPIDRDQKIMSKTDQKQALQRKPVNNSESKLDGGEKSKPAKEGMKAWMIILPMALLFAGVGGAYFINHNNISLSSINPFALFGKDESKTTKPVETEHTTADVTNNTQSSADTVHSLNPFSETETNNTTEEPAHETAITGQSGRYFVVVGSFVNKKNAFKLKHKISAQGTDATIMEPGEKSRFYLVSVADFDNHEEATSKMKELRASFGNTIWVKKF